MAAATPLKAHSILALATTGFLLVLPVTVSAGERVTNGGFGSSTGWTDWTERGTVTRNFNSTAVPAGGTTPCLQISSGDMNGGVYQALSLVNGQQYTLSVKSRDVASPASAAWAEVHIHQNLPANGSDYTVGQLMKWDTWACDNWNGTAACVQNTTTFTAAANTMYLVLKVGGNVSVSFDNVSVNGPDPAAQPGAPTVNSVPGQPTQLTVANNAGDSVTNYFAFRVNDGSNKWLQADGTLGASAVWQLKATWGTKTVTGLSPDKQYRFEVRAALDASGNFMSPLSSQVFKYTVASTPGAPTVGTPTATSLNIAANATAESPSNPTTTDYAITITGGAFGATDGVHWVPAAGGAPVGTPAYQDKSLWTAKTVSGLANSTTYTFKVIARNGDGVTSAYSAGASGTTSAVLTPLAPATGYTEKIDFSSTATGSSYWDGDNIPGSGIFSVATYSDGARTQRGSSCVKGTISGSGSYFLMKKIFLKPNTAGNIRVWMAVPTGATNHWIEAAYRLGANTGNFNDGDPTQNGWVYIKKFDGGVLDHHNGGAWTEYSAAVTTDATGQVNIGIKAGASGGSATVYWDCFSVQDALLDTAGPAVQSSNRHTPSGQYINSSTSSVIYRVTFSENVTGVDSSDFVLTKTSTANGTIGATTKVNDNAYNVSVGSLSGEGDLRLDVKASGTGIADFAGNALSGGFTTGQVYTRDVTAPTLSVGAPSASLTRTGPVTYTVTYTGADAITLALGNITLNKTGTANGSLAVSGTGNTTRTVTVSSITGTGMLGISIAAGTASDAAANAAPASGPSTAFEVDNTAPMVTEISPPTPTSTISGPVAWSVSLSESVTGFDSAADIQVNAAGTVAAGSINVAGSGAGPYTVTLSSLTGAGTLGITVKAGSCADAAGNSNTVSSASQTALVGDNASPSITAITPSSTCVDAGGTISLTATVQDNPGGSGVTASGIFLSVPSGVGNLLNNPSFESDHTGWTNTSSPSYSIGNSYPNPGSAIQGSKWEGTSCGFGSGLKAPELRQSVTVTPGATYYLSVWVHTDGSPNPCSAFLQWKDGPATADGQGITVDSLTSNSSGWQQLAGFVTPTQASLTLILRLSWDCGGAGGGGNFDWAVVAPALAPDSYSADVATWNSVALPYATELQILARDVAGNIATASSATIQMNPATPSNPTATPAIICAGGSSTLSATVAGGEQMDWYADTCGGTAVTSLVTPTATTAYYARARNSATGCVSTSCASVTVTVNPNPETPQPSSNSPICAGETLNLMAPPVANATYNWSGPGGFSSSEQNPILPGATEAHAGEYTVTVTVNGCTSAAGTTQVVVNPTPAAPTASTNAPIGAGQTLNLYAGDVPGATYEWTGPGGYTSSEQNPARENAQPAMSGDYLVTVTVNGCQSAPASVHVDVYGQPTAPTAANNGPLCEGEILNLTATPGQPGTYTWSWTGPNGFTSTEQNPVILPVGLEHAGEYQVTATAYGLTSDPATTTVVVNALPDAPIAGNNGPLCEGGTLNLTASTLANASYQWTGPNAFASTDQNPSIAGITLSQAGVYEVTVTVDGCTSVGATTEVDVRAVPTAPMSAAANPASICAGGSSTLSADLPQGLVLEWFTESCGGALLPGGASPTVSPEQTTIYYARARYADLTCPTSECAQVTVTVNTLPAAPTGAQATPASVCPGGTSVLSATVPDGLTIDWYAGDCNGTPIGSGQAIQVAPVTDTTYYARARDAAGCVSSQCALVTVTTKQPPQISEHPQNQTVCEDMTASFNVSANGAGLTYQWYVSTNGGTNWIPIDAAIEPTYSFTVTAADDGKMYYCIVNGACPPADPSNAATLTVDSPPTVAIGSPSPAATNAGPVSFTVTYSDANVVTLAPGDVTLVKTGTADATIVVSGSGNTERMVTLSDLTGGGTLAISLAAGTAAYNACLADAAGPSAAVVVDNTLPVVSITGATQDAQMLIGGAVNAVQGSPVLIAVTASDSGGSGLNGQPVVTVTPSGGPAEPATFVNESPPGTFNYSWTVQAATSNGTAAIHASVADTAGNTATAVAQNISINKNQVTGEVAFETLAGTHTFTRAVAFTATDSGGAVLKSWTQSLAFTSSDPDANPATENNAATAGYTLRDVPEGTDHLSAKTAWTLRRRLDCDLAGSANKQATVDFSGPGALLGGDLDDSNSINILDYARLKKHWFSSEPGADLNGDGSVNLLDYTILKNNWWQIGSPQ